jgi:hypothetical protein
MVTRSRLVLLAALAGIACGTSLAGPDDPIVVEPLEVDSVQVSVGATRPAQVIARVTGTLGSGCDYLHAIEQSRQGNEVVIQVKRSRFTPGPCTMIHKSFEQELGLAGGFTPGDYTLRVNGVTRTFTVQ